MSDFLEQGLRYLVHNVNQIVGLEEFTEFNWKMIAFPIIYPCGVKYKKFQLLKTYSKSKITDSDENAFLFILSNFFKSSFVCQVSCHENIPLSLSSSPSCPVSIICSFFCGIHRTRCHCQLGLSRLLLGEGCKMRSAGSPPSFSYSGTFPPSLCTFQMPCIDQ